MIKDIFDREIQLGDLVYAHNETHTNFTPHPRWICLVVGDDLCFATGRDYLNPEQEYSYIFKMDSCILIGHLNDSVRAEEDELRNKLISEYKNYTPTKKYSKKTLLDVNNLSV